MAMSFGIAGGFLYKNTLKDRSDAYRESLHNEAGAKKHKKINRHRTIDIQDTYQRPSAPSPTGACEGYGEMPSEGHGELPEYPEEGSAEYVTQQEFRD